MPTCEQTKTGLMAETETKVPSMVWRKKNEFTGAAGFVSVVEDIEWLHAQE